MIKHLDPATCGWTSGLPKNEKPDLEAIRKRLGAATPGPWGIGDDLGHTVTCDGGTMATIWRSPRKNTQSNEPLANAEFVSNSRTDVEQLLNYISYLEDERVTSATKILKLSQALEMATNRIDLQEQD